MLKQLNCLPFQDSEITHLEKQEMTDIAVLVNIGIQVEQKTSDSSNNTID